MPNGIFKALHQRIQRENQELNPLTEELTPDHVADLAHGLVSGIVART